ncbi:Down syndrome cell adhesion molecule 1 homolog, partial [Paramuricea clavata]
MGDRDQTKRSESYSLKYSNDKSLVDGSSAVQITGNQNGYQASTTLVDIYNVRYIKIQSTASTDFCLRIELCGEAQMPAPVDELQITPSDTSARVTWVIHEKTVSSLITKYYIYLNGQSQPHVVSRAEDGTQIVIPGLKPYTVYTVGIETVDGALQRSRRVSKTFNTDQAAPSGPPSHVRFTYWGKNRLDVSWNAPDTKFWNGVLTRYLLCYANQTRARRPRCRFIRSGTRLQGTIYNLQPTTKYFVTVSAGTKVGYGNKSLEISKITSG